jgi:hypothetical protein
MTIRYFVHGDDTASAESDACAARLLGAGYELCTQADYSFARAQRDNARRLAMQAEQAAQVPVVEEITRVAPVRLVPVK